MSAPTAYAYQWRRGGVNITGATTSTYALITADAGTSVDCLVTASNTGGATSQASNALAIAAGAPTSVWSADDASANGMTLSNGGLTVTAGPVAYQSIRGTVSHTTGKYYIEFNMVGGAIDGATGDPEFGIANAGFSPLDYIGHNPISAGTFSGATSLNAINPSTNFTSNYATHGNFPALGDVWSIAIDLTSGNYWLAQNNVWFGSGNPATGANPMLNIVGAGLGLAYFPAMALRNGSTVTGVWTLQSTAAAQKYAPPSGFSAWDSAAPTHSPQALAYLARTVGGNEGGNGANIATLIDGLVSDGVWAKLDCLYVLAQQNQSDALLNLVGTSYGLTGSLLQQRALTFASYVGFHGFVSGFDTGFNPSTATSPNFTQNSASFGVWAYSSAAEAAGQIGNYDNGASGESHIYNNYSGSFYARVNAPSTPGVASPGTPGLYVGDRPSSASIVPYYSGAAQATQSGASQVPFNTTFKIGQGGANEGISTQTLSAAFIGASLGAAGQLALYNRLRTYMTAIGVP